MVFVGAPTPSMRWLVPQDSSEAGVLIVDGGSATVKDCHFCNLLRQAIEVRTAGEVEVRDSTIRRA